MTATTSQKQNQVRRKVKGIESRFEFLRTLMSILIAMAIILIMVLLLSDDPTHAIKQLILGPLTSRRRFANVLELLIPLTFTGLAITITFKVKRFNLISEGSFYLGAILACVIGVNSPFTPPVTLFLGMVAAIVAGCLLGYIPALLNEKFGASELVTSLMLNYVVGYLVLYIFNNVVRDTSSSSLQSLPLPDGVDLGQLLERTRLHWGLVIVLILVVLAYVVIYKTKWGYSLRATGLNEQFAHYAGVKVTTTIILAQVIGSAIAGLGGATEMFGIYDSFKWSESPGYGFDGVIIATLARNNPLYVPLAAFFLAYLRTGADILNRTSDIPAEIISVVQAIIILLIAAKAFLSKWKQQQIVKVSTAAHLEEEEA
ncbi:ABC transporter permease [Vaginisenegalia massiliensis]|uniref:ABC transporter permease n=1 Tax=Vaginisenegalia massiliensis TaxID=2058294 RepID=UPI000F53B808|nr:ABC transporter permease [Vaginisenegalia massiliensis]